MKRAGLVVIASLGAGLACSSFEAAPDATGGSSGTASSSGAPAPGGDGGAADASGSGVVPYADASTACFPGCSGFLCDDFERGAPDSNGWTFFAAEVREPGPEFKIEPDIDCNARLRAGHGDPKSEFAARMLRRRLSGNDFTSLTIELDIGIDTDLESIGEDDYSVLVALTPGGLDLSPGTPFVGIVATRGGVAVAGQVSAQDQKNERLAVDLNDGELTHLRWHVNTNTGAMSVFVGTETTAATGTFPLAFQGKTPSALELFVGAGSTKNAASMTARFDNVSVAVP